MTRNQQVDKEDFVVGGEVITWLLACCVVYLLVIYLYYIFQLSFYVASCKSKIPRGVIRWLL